MTSRTWVLILCWNNFEDTAECVRSVRSLEGEAPHILVIDNQSTDGTVDRLRREFNGLDILVNPSNLGYAGGNNAGLARAFSKGADYALILNNDVLVEPSLLNTLLDEAEKNDRAAFVAPLVLYADTRDTINAIGTSMDWFKLRPRIGLCGKSRALAPARTLTPEIIVGCAWLVPKRTVDRIGLLDERFFLIHEDADWCMRARRAGLLCRVVTDAVVYHKNSRTLSKHALLTHYYSTRNILYLAAKHAGPMNKASALAGLLIFILQNALFLLSGGPKAARARSFFAGVVDWASGRMGRTSRAELL